MSETIKAVILQALKTVRAPGTELDVVSSGLISSVIIKGEGVGFVLQVSPSDDAAAYESLRKRCEEAVAAISGVNKVTAVLSAEIADGSSAAASGIRIEPKSGAKPGVNPPRPKKLPGVANIIAVMSGKGGVGKSTVAVNLAVALGMLGYRTGLVDADIYGPSVARMMGVSGKPEVADNRIITPESFGIKCLSMGMLLDEDAPAVWRGPMIAKALQQLMLGAAWAPLDVLVMDMPPGTGDIHISVMQNFLLTGAVIVTTPQRVALMDVKKAIHMARKMDVPILGVVENMGYFLAPESGEVIYPFGPGELQAMLTEMNLEKLGALPLLPDIARCGDNGTPFVAANPGSDAAKNYLDAARKVARKLVLGAVSVMAVATSF